MTCFGIIFQEKIFVKIKHVLMVSILFGNAVMDSFRFVKIHALLRV